MSSLYTVGTSSAHYSVVCRTCASKTACGFCGAPWTRTSYNINASHDSCSPHQCGPHAAISSSHHGPQTTSNGRSNW